MTSGYIDVLGDRKRFDQRVLKLLLGLLSIVLLASLIIQLLEERMAFTAWLADLFTGLVVVFLVMGLLLFRHHHGRGLVSTERILGYLTVASLAFGLVAVFNPFAESIEFLIGGFMIDLEYGDLTVFMLDLLVLVTFALAFLSFLYIIGFGVVGVIAAIDRLAVPRILEHIEGLRFDGTDGRWDRLMVWVFNIPYVMDTSRVVIDVDARREDFPVGEMRRALTWEMLFSVIVAVYISLNPIFLDEATTDQLLGIAAAASVFIPFLILPWFIYKALDARIVGQRNDFDLYRGIRNTFVGATVALGTVIIFMKIGLEEAAGEGLVDLFIGYFLFNLVVGVMFTFIYFNSFENDLIDDITQRFIEREHGDR